MNRTPEVAIIGGGWAGLAAAVELCAAGARVVVFEAAKQLGGRARRVDVHGHALDNGQHILIGAYRETLRLMRLVGADEDASLKRLPLELNYPGANFRLRLPRLPKPLHLAVGLLSARGCSLGAKFSAARFMQALQASDFALTTDCTVAELLDRHNQRGAIRRLMWEPLCLAALNTPPEHASAQIFANVLRDSLGGSRADTDLLLPTVDLGLLFPEHAARFIERHGGSIRLSTRVESVTRSRADTHLCINGESFAHVIVATAPQHAARLLQPHPETETIVRTLADYCYEPIGTVYLGYPSEVRLPFPMLGMDEGKPGQFGQWVFDRGQLGGAHGVMGFVLSAEGTWDECDNAVLADALHRELQTMLGRSLPPPHWHQVIRERRATFSCRPNLPRPPRRTPVGELWLAGDYVCADYPATLEGAVRSGIQTACEVLKATS
ncbi:hydroxysqualene dehydroxylase HpnE [Propionivibrio limicola]|uniref:hydroxysqualene dehydroxylase HpnE n=1 Tax=Propionivibrio limicola TaxID=167645 RepID=UPI001292ADD9|nr:hydroxysqualene dehydroxylase HpnE [Propionivibrio limicola]